MRALLTDVARACSIVIAGNKIDLQRERMVTIEEAEECVARATGAH